MIYHILKFNEWENFRSKDHYKPESLIKEGFIHCSTIDKTEESANRFFRGEHKLIILCIDEKMVNSEIIREDLYNTGFNFPHIYGELNLNSVVRTFSIESDRNGKFIISENLLKEI